MKTYKPLRLEEETIDSINDFFMGSDFTKKTEGIFNTFFSIIEITKKMLILKFKKEYFYFLIEILDDSFIEKLKADTNFKQALTLKVHESIITEKMDDNFSIDPNWLLKTISEELSIFDCFVIIYMVAYYKKKYSAIDVNNIYFDSYFSTV